MGFRYHLSNDYHHSQNVPVKLHRPVEIFHLKSSVDESDVQGVLILSRQPLNLLVFDLLPNLSRKPLTVNDQIWSLVES